MIWLIVADDWLDILLSLVRTKNVGHIRDVRRLVVALSRARLGLYVFCRKRLFENSYELTPAFRLLLQRPVKLALKVNEEYPAQRKVDDTGSVKEIDDLKAMGQLVYQMQLDLPAEAMEDEDNEQEAMQE